MPRRTLAATIVATTLLGAGPALACSSLDEAMSNFRLVTDAFSAQASSISPDKFPIWTAEVQRFSDSMGQMDYGTACAVLVGIVDQLELDVQLAGVPTAAPPAGGSKSSGSASGGGSDSVAVTPPAASSDQGTQADGGSAAPAAPQPAAPVAAPPATEVAVVARGRVRSRPPRLW